MDLRGTGCDGGLDSCVSRQEPVAGSCDSGGDPL
jgi:hypothetical protein